MTQAEINTLEHAGRTAMAWFPEGYDGTTHYSYVLKAMTPAIGILDPPDQHRLANDAGVRERAVGRRELREGDLTGAEGE